MFTCMDVNCGEVQTWHKDLTRLLVCSSSANAGGGEM